MRIYAICAFVLKLSHFVCCHLLTTNVKEIHDDANWMKNHDLGQISAVTVDKNGNIYVFHRGSRKWEANTFTADERYAKVHEGPIRNNTIAVFNTNGNVIAMTGKDLFYMPHGLTVDHELNLWVTDVALHQVIKFPSLNASKRRESLRLALLTLGKPLVPGAGTRSFCKPTSVVVDPLSNDFFVADGYCNSRIVKFDKNGQYLLHWGQPTGPGFYRFIGNYNLFVPHSLTLDEGRRQVIVADRENSRIVCYTTDGHFVRQVNTGNRVYGISYSPVTDDLYAVTGTTFQKPGSGLIFSMSLGNLTGVFNPAGNFKNAHDVAVSPDGHYVYAVELDPFVVWRFTVGETSISATAEKQKTDEVAAYPKKFQGPEEPKPGGTEGLPQLDADISTGTASLGANQLAVTIVTAVVLLGIIVVSCHMYRKKGVILSSERRGLILDDEDNRIL